MVEHNELQFGFFPSFFFSSFFNFFIYEFIVRECYKPLLSDVVLVAPDTLSAGLLENDSCSIVSTASAEAIAARLLFQLFYFNNLKEFTLEFFFLVDETHTHTYTYTYARTHTSSTHEYHAGRIDIRI